MAMLIKAVESAMLKQANIIKYICDLAENKKIRLNIILNS
jgi:hypothetical protein